MPPPSPYKHIDTCRIAAETFGFTSNKLEYLTEKLCTKYKKLKHKRFPGNELWDACEAGNAAAWAEMERYNNHDVLALEELAGVLLPWSNKINFSTYRTDEKHVCSCGSDQFERRGFSYTATARYQRYLCLKCGAWSRGSSNLIEKDRAKSLHRRAS